MSYNKFPFKLPFILDGATGTELAKRGMQKEECTERFVLENPNVIKSLQREYMEAGSDAVLAPTFGANRATLERHGFLAEDVKKTCQELFNIAKSTADGKKIAADISPTGLMIAPFGDTPPETVYNIYHEQAETLIECGADFFFVETMISAAEALLAVKAVRDISKDIPVFVSMTVDESGRTMNGDSLDAVLITLAQYDIQAFGCNCSIGPEVIYNALKPAAPFAKLYGIPLIAKPNAGMPVTKDGITQYPLTPLDMAGYVDKLTELGVGVFGGCCGTTPAHIEAIAGAARSTSKELFSDVTAAEDETYVSTTRAWGKVDKRSKYISIDKDSEDEIYDITEECEEDEVLYFELKEGAAELLLAMDGFISNPIAVCGDEAEVLKAEKLLARKIK